MIEDIGDWKEFGPDEPIEITVAQTPMHMGPIFVYDLFVGGEFVETDKRPEIRVIDARQHKDN